MRANRGGELNDEVLRVRWKTFTQRSADKNERRFVLRINLEPLNCF